MEFAQCVQPIVFCFEASRFLGSTSLRGGFFCDPVLPHVPQDFMKFHLIEYSKFSDVTSGENPGLTDLQQSRDNKKLD